MKQAELLLCEVNHSTTYRYDTHPQLRQVQLLAYDSY